MDVQCTTDPHDSYNYNEYLLNFGLTIERLRNINPTRIGKVYIIYYLLIINKVRNGHAVLSYRVRWTKARHG